MPQIAVSEILAGRIVSLRLQGYSYERIAAELNIGTSTAKKYAPFGTAIHLPRNKADKTPFTDRQIEIALAAMEKREQEGLKP